MRLSSLVSGPIKVIAQLGDKAGQLGDKAGPTPSRAQGGGSRVQVSGVRGAIGFGVAWNPASGGARRPPSGSLGGWGCR